MCEVGLCGWVQSAELLRVRQELACLKEGANEHKEEDEGMGMGRREDSFVGLHAKGVHKVEAALCEQQVMDARFPSLSLERRHLSPSSTKVGESSGVIEDFPHLALINDLLDEEQLIGAPPSHLAAFPTKVRQSSLRGDAPPFEIRDRGEPRFWKGNGYRGDLGSYPHYPQPDVGSR